MFNSQLRHHFFISNNIQGGFNLIYINFEDVVFTLYYVLGINYIEPRDISVETIEVFAKYWMEYLEKNHSKKYLHDFQSRQPHPRPHDYLCRLL